MDSDLLLKFIGYFPDNLLIEVVLHRLLLCGKSDLGIGYFPDYLSALSRMLLRFFWTTFVETAVYDPTNKGP